jgi:hypothetical protein
MAVTAPRLKHLGFYGLATDAMPPHGDYLRARQHVLHSAPLTLCAATTPNVHLCMCQMLTTSVAHVFTMCKCWIAIDQ